MQAGRLRHRVTLQRATESRDSFGQVVKTWADVATVWARVEALSGREYLEAQSLQRQVTTRMTIRWRSDVDAGLRALWRGRVYDIESALADETGRRSLTLMCVEVT